MLPSFRLIAATFLCGFVVVFAGLRMAVSLHDIHEGLPVMAAHAAPVSVAPAADDGMRRGQTTVPVMYDLRFAVSAVSPTMVRVAPAGFDRPAPALSIWPPQGLSEQGLSEQGSSEQDLAETAKETPEPESTVAAIQTDAPVSVAPDAPASLEAPAEVSIPETPAVAAVEPQATPGLEAGTAETPIPEPDTTASVDPPDQALDPAPSAIPASVTKPKAAKPAAKAVAVAKVVRKKSIPTAEPANNPLGIDPASNPFGIPQQ